MKDDNQPPVNENLISNENSIPKKGSINLIVKIGILIAGLFMLGISFYLYHTKIVNEKDLIIQELTAQTQELNTKLSQTKMENQKLTCKGKWDDINGCVPNQLVLISPNGGEKYCLGDNIPITWKGPTDMSSISIWLSTPSSGSSNLGEFLAVGKVEDGVGYGELIWKGRNVIGQLVDPKDFYKIDLNVSYEGETLQDSSDSIFSITDCT